MKGFFHYYYCYCFESSFFFCLFLCFTYIVFQTVMAVFYTLNLILHFNILLNFQCINVCSYFSSNLFLPLLASFPCLSSSIRSAQLTVFNPSSPLAFIFLIFLHLSLIYFLLIFIFVFLQSTFLKHFSVMLIRFFFSSCFLSLRDYFLIIYFYCLLNDMFLFYSSRSL